MSSIVGPETEVSDMVAGRFDGAAPANPSAAAPSLATPLDTSALAHFRADVRAFLRAEIVPHVDAWEGAGGLPREMFRVFGRAGLLGLTGDPHYGGQGHDLWHDVVLLEELAAARSAGVGASIVSHAVVCAPLLEAYGSPAQKEVFLRPVLAGDCVAAIAATEPQAGSDFDALACRASDRGDHWQLDGEKKFITNVPVADLVLVLARRDDARGPHGFVLLLVPRRAPGCEVLAPLRTLGLRSSPLGWLRFTRCRVPKAATLGEPDGGFLYAARQLMVERLLASVGVIALGRLMLDDTIAYVRRRRAQGSSLGAFQVVRHTLVDCATDLEAARRFAYALCASAASGRLEERAICMLKIRAAELLQRLAGICLQLHGAAGFLDDHWLARVYRDARAFSLAGGSTAMLKDLIAGYLRL